VFELRHVSVPSGLEERVEQAFVRGHTDRPMPSGREVAPSATHKLPTIRVAEMEKLSDSVVGVIERLP
jgi:hypothetical protein